LPEGLAESELFGHEKGSFTGAIGRKIGKFELANQGTILLDEITEMAVSLQPKLLRVIQEREIDRVGGAKPIPIDVRIIAISNRDVKKAVREGKLREDLFYRLNVIPITIPPLKDRKSDIPLLAEFFLEKYASHNDRKMKRIADETVALLLKYDWKGNIRELENTIERAVLLGKGEVLLPKHLFLEEPAHTQTNADLIRVGISVREMEKELIFRTLQEVNDNRTKAANILGISIRTLRNKLREYREEHTH
jgi:transcriptional regulator with PAS, ATPase and Fis domain